MRLPGLLFIVFAPVLFGFGPLPEGITFQEGAANTVMLGERMAIYGVPQGAGWQRYSGVAHACQTRHYFGYATGGKGGCTLCRQPNASCSQIHRSSGADAGERPIPRLRAAKHEGAWT